VTESAGVRATIFQLDSFTTTRFAGNPAAVVVLDHFLPDASLQAIAAESNLAETAFLVTDGAEHHLRWFTPTRRTPWRFESCRPAGGAPCGQVLPELLPI
jgi:PhzF family phenazine biosynthesis protein